MVVVVFFFLDTVSHFRYFTLCLHSPLQVLRLRPHDFHLKFRETCRVCTISWVVWADVVVVRPSFSLPLACLEETPSSPRTQ